MMFALTILLLAKAETVLKERKMLDVQIRKVESELEELLIELARLHVLDLLDRVKSGKV